MQIYAQGKLETNSGKELKNIGLLKNTRKNKLATTYLSGL